MDQHPIPIDKRRLCMSRPDHHAVGYHLNHEFNAWGQAALLPQTLRHNDPPRSVNGSFHAKMVFRVAVRVNAAGMASDGLSPRNQGCLLPTGPPPRRSARGAGRGYRSNLSAS